MIRLSKDKEWYIISFRKKTVNKLAIAVIIFGAITLTYAVFHSYRYERFKDGHKYMRYDKWLDKYEKYDIPTKEWKELTR